MKLLDILIEGCILVWVMVWLIPALPELIEQGKYEQDPEGYKNEGYKNEDHC
jgi:hypothetical protein